MLTDIGDLSLLDALKMGKVPGAQYWGKFATGIIGTSPSTIMSSNPSGQLLTYPTTQQTVWIASTDPDDTLGGSGCQYVHVQGLDNDFKLVIDIVEMNGQTPVETTQEFFRIYRMFNADNEPHDVQGQIYMSLSGTGWSGGEPDVPECHINNGYNQSQIGVYTVPDGYRLMIMNWWMESLKSKETEMWMVFRENVNSEGNPQRVFRMRSNWGFYRNNIKIGISDAPLILKARSEFEIRGINLNSGTETVHTTLNGYLVPERFFE